MSSASPSNKAILARISIVVGAGIWGLFWLPLRYLDNNGVEGIWAVALTMATTLVIAVPVALWKSTLPKEAWRWFLLLGIGMGTSAIFYFAAIILTDVIRAVFLFYMLPIWATIASWLIYGERISRRQLIAILFALLGLYLLLGGDGGWPIPRNLGDWFGLLSGILWALSLTLLRGNPGIDPYLATAAPFLFGTPIAIVIGMFLLVIVPESASAWPEFSHVWPLLPASLLFGIVVLWPSLFGQIWGARHVSAPSAALLTMSEILLATLSSWFLIGSSLTPLAIVGACFIFTAAIVDLTAMQDETAPGTENSKQ